MTEGPSYDYEIGLDFTPEDMVNVEALMDYRAVPLGMAVSPFSFYQTAISGAEYGDGFPWTLWTFEYLTPAQFNVLMGYLSGAQSAIVYIRTREADGATYTNYRGVMHRPKMGEDCQWMAGAGMWQNVKIRFTMLEEQEET